MRLLFLLATALFSSHLAHSQQDWKSDSIYAVVDKTAEPVGGMRTFYEMIGWNIQIPKAARKKYVAGKVFVEFVIEKDGTITNIRTLKGMGYGCDQEAERVVGLSPKWNPALVGGRPVRQKFVLPITFNVPRTPPNED